MNPYVFRIWFSRLLRAFLRDGISLRVLVFHSGDEPVRLDQVCSNPFFASYRRLFWVARALLLVLVGIFWVRLPVAPYARDSWIFHPFLFGLDFVRFGLDFVRKSLFVLVPLCGLNFPHGSPDDLTRFRCFLLTEKYLLIKRGPDAAFLFHLFLFAFLSVCSCCVKVSWPEF